MQSANNDTENNYKFVMDNGDDEFNQSDVKTQINNLLWMNLAGNTTLDEMETLSLEIFTSIQDLHISKTEQQENQS